MGGGPQFSHTLHCPGLSFVNYDVLTHSSETVMFHTAAETMITPEQFAEVLCDDLELPSSSFSAAIASSIRQQCEQFSGDMIPDDEEDRRVIIKVYMYLQYRWLYTCTCSH